MGVHEGREFDGFGSALVQILCRVIVGGMRDEALH